MPKVDQFEANAQRTILLIEDQEGIQRLVVNWLTKRGYEVVAVSTAAEALAWLEQFRADAILIDETLPDMDSIALIQQIRAQSPRPMPFLIWLNAHPCIVERIQELKDTVDAYLTKPFNPMELTTFLKRMFAL